MLVLHSVAEPAILDVKQRAHLRVINIRGGRCVAIKHEALAGYCAEIAGRRRIGARELGIAGARVGEWDRWIEL